MKNKITIDHYIMYGLNRNRKFLRLPRNIRTVTLETDEDIDEFASEILKSKECECALFFVHLDGTYSSIFKTIFSQDFEEGKLIEESDVLITYSICKSQRKDDMHLFAWLDGQFRFCCYSLLVEVDDGVYEVCG